MNKNRLGLILLLGGLLMCPAILSAQSERTRHRKGGMKKEKMTDSKKNRSNQGPAKAEIIELSDGGDEDLVILDYFYQNAPKSFNAPGAPRFALVGKQKKFYMGIGGYLKGTASFDFGNPIDNPLYFTTSSIPMNQQPGNGGLYQMSAGSSNIFFNFVGMPGRKHQLGAYINFNLANPNYGFDLQYAYLTYAGLTVGYKFSMMFDEIAGPPTIDQEGPSSLAAVFRTVANYTFHYKDWQFGVGVEAPTVSATTNSYTTNVNQRIPDIPAYAQYSWNKGNNTVRLSAIMRNMQYRDLMREKNHNLVGWGVQLTGTADLCPFVSVYYQGIYGRGISNLIQDIAGLGLDMVPDQSDKGKLKAVEAWGAYGGIQFNFTKKVFSSHTYSQVRNYAHNYTSISNAWNSKYRYAQYLVHNVFWQVTPTIQLGAEYIWGRLAIMDGERKNDHRIQTMIQFNF